MNNFKITRIDGNYIIEFKVFGSIREAEDAIK